MVDEVKDAAWRAARMIRELEPGPLAAVRRMDAVRRCASYWRLAASAPAMERAPEAWVEILRAMALLTPKGRPENRGPVKATVRLGRALCDGGGVWDGHRPVISETRLARLLAARGAQRHVALTRAIRALAPKWPKDMQVCPEDLAWAYLSARSDVLAGEYYRCLDGAGKAEKETAE